MKGKLFLVVAMIGLLSSCATLKRPIASSIVLVNYEKYANKGFFFTESNSVNFEYKPLGSIIAYIMSGVEEIKEPGRKKDDIYSEGIKTKYIPATPEKALEEMYNKAVSIGANAVINLTIKPILNSKLGIIDGYSASGMAIKK